MLLATQCYIALRDIRNGETSFNPFPGEADINGKAVIRIYEMSVDGDVHCITNSFYKNLVKIEIPSQGCELYIF